MKKTVCLAKERTGLLQIGCAMMLGAQLLASQAALASSDHMTFLVDAWRRGMLIAFRLSDANRDGFLSRTEVAGPRAAGFFETNDFNHDGRVSAEEMCGHRFEMGGVNHLLSDAALHFPWLDRNHDGRIDVKELALLDLYTYSGRMSEPEPVRANAFTEADMDGDLTLSREEFERYLGVLFGQNVGWARSEK